MKLILHPQKRTQNKTEVGLVEQLTPPFVFI